MSGQRTNGCCVHVGTLIYYLSNLIQLARKSDTLFEIKLPGDYLNRILVNVNSEEPSNKPISVKNKRKNKDISSSSESDKDLSSSSSECPDDKNVEKQKLKKMTKKKSDKKESSSSFIKVTEKKMNKINKTIVVKKVMQADKKYQDKKKNVTKNENKVIKIKESIEDTSGNCSLFLTVDDLRNDEWLTDREIYVFFTKNERGIYFREYTFQWS